MTETWVALTGLRYPDGDREYDKALAGRKYKVRVVEPGDVAINLPAKSLDAYLAFGREVIVTQAEWEQAHPPEVVKP